jgi:hypothetical protein
MQAIPQAAFMLEAANGFTMGESLSVPKSTTPARTTMEHTVICRPTGHACFTDHLWESRACGRQGQSLANG